jgi:LacI family transcriptional regulator
MNPDGKLTLYEIAKLAGVSKSSVSRVLMNQRGISEQTRRRILDIMKTSGYRPSQFARGLAGGRTGLIAVMTPGIFSGYYADVLRGIDVVAHARGVHLITSFSHGPDDYRSLLEEFTRPGRVDGLILVAPAMDTFRMPAPAADVPVVLVSARPPRRSTGWERLDSVTVNNERAIERAMTHLQELGCRRVIHLAGPSGVFDARERRRAFENFCRMNRVIQGHVVHGEETRHEAVSALMEFLDKSRGKPDAIVTYNDDMAVGVVRALREKRIRVPEDVCVTGCDDEQPAELLGLTTLHMPMVELGEEAARLLFGRIDGAGAGLLARQNVLDMGLVVRSTTSSRRKM